MKRTITSDVLFLFTLTVVYILWAIQPPTSDDWVVYPVRFFIPPAGPQWRQMITEVLSNNPLSWFRQSIFIIDIIFVSTFWIVLKKEGQGTRFILTLLLAVGFPYLGTVATWCVASGMYGLSAALMIIWFLFYISFKNDERPIISCAFFVLTFFTSISHEVWLLSFPMVVLFVIWEGFRTKKRRDIFNALLIALGYMGALAYYTKGGPHQYIDQRQFTPGLFSSLFTVHHLWCTIIYGTKENLLLLKDSIPVFLLVAYIKGRNAFKDFGSRIFIFLFIGILIYIYINYFLIGPPQWRCRWLCVCGLTLVFLSIPINFTQKTRYICLVLACAWFFHNGLLTYYYTNIDVKGWLEYRNKVIHHDTMVLNETPYWGKQDNKYRFFWPPKIKEIKPRILEYWKNH